MTPWCDCRRPCLEAVVLPQHRTVLKHWQPRGSALAHTCRRRFFATRSECAQPRCLSTSCTAESTQFKPHGRAITLCPNGLQPVHSAPLPLPPRPPPRHVLRPRRGDSSDGFEEATCERFGRWAAAQVRTRSATVAAASCWIKAEPEQPSSAAMSSAIPMSVEDGPAGAKTAKSPPKRRRLGPGCGGGQWSGARRHEMLPGDAGGYTRVIRSPGASSWFEAWRVATG